MQKLKVIALFNKLIEYSTGFSGGNYQVNDTTQHFIRYFFSKLIEQSSSFLILYINNKTDAMLVARSIIEGFSLLLYIKSNPEYHSSRWLRYSNIEAYRYFLELERNGAQINKSLKEKLETYISENCSEFIVESKYGLCINGKKYCNSWYHPDKITPIVNKIDSSMIKIAYSEYSNWHHWGPLSRLNTLGKEGNEYFLKEHEGLENSILVVSFA